jgi:predicted dehydrogenase
LVATCDLNAEKAAAFARQFGAQRSYSDFHVMLKEEQLDAVFIVTNYDELGRPRYVPIAAECLKAGKHVWMEKPPAATVAEIEHLEALAGNLNVMVGFKKMFFPANEKAHQLIHSEAFGNATLATLQYPQSIPTPDEFHRYLIERKNIAAVQGFLDHLCHPVALLLYLMGMPGTLFYQRTPSGAGVATFGYADGRIATLTFAHRASDNGGMERTMILSEHGGQVVVENNIRVLYQRDAASRGYGSSPSYYISDVNEASTMWEPEFSLGQLYNKGIFLLGYFGEVNEFAQSILEKRPLAKCHLQHARQITQIFAAFARGPGKAMQI